MRPGSAKFSGLTCCNTLRVWSHPFNTSIADQGVMTNARRSLGSSTGCRHCRPITLRVARHPKSGAPWALTKHSGIAHAVWMWATKPQTLGQRAPRTLKRERHPARREAASETGCCLRRLEGNCCEICTPRAYYNGTVVFAAEKAGCVGCAGSMHAGETSW